MKSTRVIIFDLVITIRLEGVIRFYGYAVLPVFRLYSVSAFKSIGSAVLNIATVNGFWRYLGRFSGLYGGNVWFSDFGMKYLRHHKARGV